MRAGKLHILCTLLFVSSNSVISQSIFWRTNIGPDASIIQGIVQDQFGTVFVGTYGGGVFKSTNAGGSWTQCNKGLTSLYVFRMAIASNGNIFISTHGGGSPLGVYGLFRSTNKGSSWQKVNNGLPDALFYAIQTTATGQVLAGTDANAGLYLSTNNGDSWIQTMLKFTSVRSLAVDTSGGFIVGTQSDGVFCSPNNGLSWAPINNGLSSLTIDQLIVTEKDVIFARTPSGLFRSYDLGKNWSIVSNGLPPSGGSITSVGKFSSTSIVIVSVHGISHLYDSSTTATPLTLVSAPTGVQTVYVDSLQNCFLGTGGKGLFILDHSTSAIRKAGSISSSHIMSLSVNSDNKIFAGEYYAGIFLSTDLGQSWSNLGPDGYGITSMIEAMDGSILVGTKYSGIYRTTNSGLSWQQTDLRMTTALSFVNLGNGNVLSGTAGAGVYRSTDFGVSWIQMTSSISLRSVYCLATNFYGHVFAGTDKGVYRLEQLSSGWGPVGQMTLSESVGSIFTTSFGDVYANAYRSTDNGNSWLPLRIADNPIKCIAANSWGTLYSSTHMDEIYRSSDNGQTWGRVISDSSSPDYRFFQFTPSGHLVAGTYGNGVLVSQASTTTAVYDPSNWRKSSIAHSITSYPNPFNSTLNVSFALPEQSWVDVDVYDLLGRHVSNLAKGYFAAGHHLSQWRSSKSSSGIYYVTLRAAGFGGVSRVLMLK